MPILFLAIRTATHYGWWFWLIEINMKNPKPKSDAEIIAELRKNEAQLEQRNITSESKNQELPTGPSPTGPLQTCADQAVFEALKRAVKPPPE
jgi:hypothetical protein